MSTNSVQPDDAKVELTTDHVADDAPQWVSDAVNDVDNLGDEYDRSALNDISRWLEYPVEVCTECGGGYNDSNRDLWDGPRGEHVPDVVTRCPHCGTLQ